MYEVNKRAKFKSKAAGLEDQSIPLVKPKVKIIKTPGQAKTVFSKKLKRFASLKNKLGLS